MSTTNKKSNLPAPEPTKKVQKPVKASRRLRLALHIMASLLVVCIVGVFILVWAFWGGQSKRAFRAGVTFSAKYTRELNMQPKEVMAALVTDLKVRHFRLMSYWDVHEVVQGSYDFSELDWQMKMAEDAGAKVSLAIGLRQPRWPECHTPEWAKKLSNSEKREKLLLFMQQVVERYRSSRALESYQLENEALNTAFGECQDFDRARLVNEFNSVKKWDPSHPIIISVSNEFGLPIGAPRGDEVGFSIYHRVYDAKVTHSYVEYPIPAWYHGLRASLIKFVTGRDTIIHELQAEPWGPKATANLSVAEQAESMDVARLKGRVGYAKATGIRDFDLWGAEWWYWRKTQGSDSSLWDATRPFFDARLQTKECCK